MSSKMAVGIGIVFLAFSFGFPADVRAADEEAAEGSSSVEEPLFDEEGYQEYKKQAPYDTRGEKGAYERDVQRAQGDRWGYGNRRGGGRGEWETGLEPVFFGEDAPYTLGIKDILQINVQDQPEFGGRFVIDSEGKIKYRYIGYIEAAGLRTEDLEEKIAEGLTRFIRKPEVDVKVVSYRSKFFYIVGQISDPGKYPMRGDTISLRDAIIRAGWPSNHAAWRRVEIIRSDPTDPTKRKINAYNITYYGQLQDNVDIHPGDLIVVPITWIGKLNKTVTDWLTPYNTGRRVEPVTRDIDNWQFR